MVNFKAIYGQLAPDSEQSEIFEALILKNSKSTSSLEGWI